MDILGFETCDIQGRECILVVDHDEKKVLDVLECSPAPGASEASGTPDATGALDASESPSAPSAGRAPSTPAATKLEAWVSDYMGTPLYIWVDLIPSQIEVLRKAFPESTLQIYRNAIPHLIGAEELRRLEEEYGDVTRNMGAQRHMAAVRYAFDERQLSIGAGKLTLQFVTQDLRISPEKVKRLNKLFDFCQRIMLPNPVLPNETRSPGAHSSMLREYVDAFLESPEAETIPESAALIRRHIDLICLGDCKGISCGSGDEVLDSSQSHDKKESTGPLRPMHLVKDTWLKQVERGDEETVVSYEDVVEKILAYSIEE